MAPSIKTPWLLKVKDVFPVTVEKNSITPDPRSVKDVEEPLKVTAP